MHAWSSKSGADVSRGCAHPPTLPPISATPLTTCLPWIASCRYCLRQTGFLPLTGVNVYSLLRYLVLANKLKGGEIGQPPLP